MKKRRSRTIESLSLLRERWHAKRDGEGLKRIVVIFIEGFEWALFLIVWFATFYELKSGAKSVGEKGGPRKCLHFWGEPKRKWLVFEA